MSLAIQWGDASIQDGGFIYFDAITAYTQNYKGQVTKHPVDAGGNITDHYIRDNPVFTIGGVITGVDISEGTFLIRDSNGNAPYNSNPAPHAVSVNSTDQSVLQKFIPDSVGQFLSDSTPEVVVDTRRSNLLGQIREALISLVAGEAFNQQTGQFDPNIQLINLFEYDARRLRKIINRLVITNINFKESPETGYGLYCDITFEQVTFVFLKKTDIPKDVQEGLKKKAAPKSSKGKQPSQPQDKGTGTKPPKGGVDASREAAIN